MNKIERTKKEYATRSMGELEDFIGCTINHDLTKTNHNIYQPYLSTNMNQVFNGEVESLMTFTTPATLHKGIVCNKETDTKIPYNLQKRYRNGVGFLQYLVKQSRLKLSNEVDELSKCMDKSNMIH